MRDKRQAYLLYAHPIPGARSGHAAFVVLKEGEALSGSSLHQLRDNQIDYYFSMYPDLSPQQLRAQPYTTLARKGLTPITVTSYEADVVMRGQSRHRYIIHEKEEVCVSDLLKTLPDRDSVLSQNYFKLGQYDTLVQLPKHLNVSATISALKKISADKRWAMFAPLPKHDPFSPNPDAQNCCTAIREALKAGGVDLQKSLHIMQLPVLQTFALWACYFAILILSPERLFSEKTQLDNIFLMPLGYALLRLGIGVKGAYDYYQALKLMAKDPNNVPPGLKLPILITCFFINTLCCLWQTNAVSNTFLFPSLLFREAKKLKGAEVLHATNPVPAN